MSPAKDFIADVLGLDHAIDHPESGTKNRSVRRMGEEGWLDGRMVIDICAFDVHASPRSRVLKAQRRGQAVRFR